MKNFNYFSVVGLVTVVLVILKYTHQINWEWKWVFSPCWVSAIFVTPLYILSLTKKFSKEDFNSIETKDNMSNVAEGIWSLEKKRS